MEVREYFNLKQTTGDVGIEIEVEGRNLPPAPAGWRREHDGSLRGEENGEYVLHKPVKKDSIKKALNAMEQSFKDNRTKVDKTYRAGIHVHVNVQELSVLQLVNMFTLYYTFENALLSLCEKHRQGNHFCLRACDAGWQTDYIRRTLVFGDLKRLHTDELRYSAMNTQSLFNYGSLEFRSMESYGDFDKLYLWSNLHLKLREAAKTFKTPLEVIEYLNAYGAHNLCEKVFEEFAEEFIHKCPRLAEHVQDCRDVAEDIAYCRVWGKKSLDIFDKQQNLF